MHRLRRRTRRRARQLFASDRAEGLNSSDKPSKVDDEPQSVVVEPRFPKTLPVSAAERHRRARSLAAGIERGIATRRLPSGVEDLRLSRALKVLTSCESQDSSR